MDILELMREHGYEHSGDYSNKVVKAEQDLGLSFAEDFREFLLSFGQTDIENHEITGVVLDNFLNFLTFAVLLMFLNGFSMQFTTAKSLIPRSIPMDKFSFNSAWFSPLS